MSARAAVTQDPRPDLQQRDRVIVVQAGIREWEGEVLSVKPGTHGWMVEVRNDEHLAWIVPARSVRKVDR